MIETQDLTRQLAQRRKEQPSQASTSTRDEASSNREGISCTQNAEKRTYDDDHVHEINMAGALA